MKLHPSNGLSAEKIQKMFCSVADKEPKAWLESESMKIMKLHEK